MRIIKRGMFYMKYEGYGRYVCNNVTGHSDLKGLPIRLGQHHPGQVLLPAPRRLDRR